MEENELKIRVAEESVAARTKRSSKGVPWLLCAGILLILGIGGAIGIRSQEEPAKPQASVQVDSPVSKDKEAEPTEPGEEFAAIADDGESLWVAPTAGEPLDLSYLLPGTQMILHVRVAELLAHAEGEKVLDALGPWGQQAVEKFTRTTGVELSDVRTLLLGIRPAGTGPLEYALRIHLTSPKSAEELGPNCFLPANTSGTVVVQGSSSAIDTLKAQGDEAPLFARELQRVLQRSDSDRMVTLIFAGKFLQINGEKLVRGRGVPLREALIDFLGDEATAIMLSTHWDENFCLELQSTVTLNERPHRFTALLERRVDAASDQIEDAVLASRWDPYGRKVIARLPAMLRKLGNYTRSGEVEGLSVLRSYLPVTAGHNLLMATELLINTASPDVPVRDAPAGMPRAETQTIEDILRKKTSLVFTKETLQKALELLAEDLAVPIDILGNDLQLEGITKNQSFGIELRDRPAAEILLAVLLQANPDRSASGPTDDKQKLVYVFRRSPGKGPGEIVVTTRTAVQQRGEKLPAVFVPPEN